MGKAGVLTILTFIEFSDGIRVVFAGERKHHIVVMPSETVSFGFPYNAVCKRLKVKYNQWKARWADGKRQKETN